MNKKPLWRRVNRGFVVSMALLIVTAIYVLITQLMLIPEKRAIRSLTDSYCTQMENVTLLTDEQLAAFKKADALTAEKTRLKNELSGSFTDKSVYLDDAASNLIQMISMQLDNQQRVKSRSERSVEKVKSLIDQDVATCSITYSYTASGDFMNYKSEKAEPQTDVKLRLQLELSFKKTDGQWKIYRVSNATWNWFDQSGSYGGM